jgi:hypothetical protein
MKLLPIIALFIVFLVLNGLLWYARPPDSQWLVGSLSRSLQHTPSFSCG